MTIWSWCLSVTLTRFQRITRRKARSWLQSSNLWHGDLVSEAAAWHQIFIVEPESNGVAESFALQKHGTVCTAARLSSVVPEERHSPCARCGPGLAADTDYQFVFCKTYLGGKSNVHCEANMNLVLFEIFSGLASRSKNFADSLPDSKNMKNHAPSAFSMARQRTAAADIALYSQRPVH